MGNHARRTSIALTILAAVSLTLARAPAATSAEAEMARLINESRTSNGLRALPIYADIETAARKHSREMAASGSVYHSTHPGEGIEGWRALGENVASGKTVHSIHTALMNSPPHRANILSSDYNQMGVGIVSAGDKLYVTEIFIKRTSSSPPAPKPAPRIVVHRAAAPAPIHRVGAVQHTAVPHVAVQLVVIDPSQSVEVLLRLVSIEADRVDPAAGVAPSP